MSSWTGLSIYTNDNTLASGGTVSSTEHNTHRNSVNALFVLVKAEGLASERHHDGSAAPDDTNDGVIWSDSANALHKLRQAAVWETIITGTNTAAIAGAHTFSAVQTFSSATASTSVSTGAVVLSGAAGGLGMAGALWVGGLANFADLVYIGGATVPAGLPAKGLILETGSVFGTAATGFSQIGHKATDNLAILVGATATGSVHIENTLDSTAIGNGSIWTSGGLGVTKALWVGGLANIAGAVTLQSTLALATANITGTPTITGSWIFEASQTIRRSATTPILSVETYSTAVGDLSLILLKKSSSATLGTLAATSDTDQFGSVDYYGVNSALAAVSGVRIIAIQRGAAGATSVPTDLIFYTATATAASIRRVAITTEGNLCIASTVLAPASAVHALILGNSGAVLGAATPDTVSVACIDDGAGNAGLQIQGEVGKYIIGNKGSGTVAVGGMRDISYVDATGTSGADATAQTVKSITLPANACTKVGQGIRIQCEWVSSLSTSISLALKLNGQSLFSVTFTNNLSRGLVEVVVLYTAATTANSHYIGIDPDSASAIASASQITSLDWTAAQAIEAVQTSAVGTHITVYTLSVEQLG